MRVRYKSKYFTMHQKIYLFGCVLILAISCNKPGSTKETPVNTQLQADSIVAETVVTGESLEPEESREPDEPAIETSSLMVPVFDFHHQPITDDARENSIVNALNQIINQFKEERYVTISMTYTHDDPVTMGVVQEEGTWYYNAERQLCASSKRYKSDRTSMNSHYLCHKNHLVGMTSDMDFYDEGTGYTNSVRIASTGCPRCGINLSSDDESGFELSEIDQSTTDKYAIDFFNEHEDMLETFKDVTQLTKQGERYTALVTVDSNDGVDTIKYSIDPSLIHKFFKKASIQN